MPGIEARWETLAEALGRAMNCEVVALRPLTGGASRETFRFSTSDGHAFVLQRERTTTLRRAEGMAAEASVLRAAEALGVAVPEVVLTNGDVDEPEIGTSFFVARAVDGETIARKILRSDDFAAGRAALPRQIGTALATIHRIDPSPLGWLEDHDELDKYRSIADEMGLRRPGFEVAFRWLAANRPVARPKSVVHGDFRLGNLIVDSSGLAAVIDWELAHLSDPMEDLGWVCVRAWRFGGPGRVAGVGDQSEMFQAYEAAGGEPVDDTVVRWWEILGSLKWGIMCALQANAHRSGAYRSVELISIGRRIAEQEEDLLSMIAGAGSLEGFGAVAGSEFPESEFGERSDEPTAAELLEAARERLDAAIERPLGGFEARVVRNVVAISERELALGPGNDERHRARLSSFGAASDAELATMIRSGLIDDRLASLINSLRLSAEERLAINNPKWLA